MKYRVVQKWPIILRCIKKGLAHPVPYSNGQLLFISRKEDQPAPNVVFMFIFICNLFHVMLKPQSFIVFKKGAMKRASINWQELLQDKLKQDLGSSFLKIRRSPAQFFLGYHFKMLVHTHDTIPDIKHNVKFGADLYTKLVTNYTNFTVKTLNYDCDVPEGPFSLCSWYIVVLTLF